MPLAHLHYDDAHVVCMGTGKERKVTPGSAGLQCTLQTFAGWLPWDAPAAAPAGWQLPNAARASWLPMQAGRPTRPHAPQPLPQPPVSGARQWSHISSQMSRGALPAVSRSRTKSTACREGVGRA